MNPTLFNTFLVLLVILGALAHLSQGEFTGDCARCLCEMQTGCNSKHPQGPYKISWPYWSDGGKPTVNGESPTSETAFQNCIANEKCNLDAVKGYMRNFDQDCDNDGDADCLDYARIHVHGGYGGCTAPLPPYLQKKFDACYKGQ